jgi:hypothetical protein
MTHFLECGAEDFGCLAVDEQGANFCFGGRGHNIVENAALAVYAAVVGWLPYWGFGRTAWMRTEKVMASCLAVCFWGRNIGGVTMDVKHHVTSQVAENGIRVRVAA